MTDVMEIDYGPLRELIGNWRGNRGRDVAPEPDGIDVEAYRETLTFAPAGEVENAESQKLSMLRYHQAVFRESTGEQFHDESGYWLWEQGTDNIMCCFTIPRGMAVLAGGRDTGEGTGDGRRILTVEADEHHPQWGIVQSPFLQRQARTLRFRRTLTFGEGRLSYEQNTVLDIYGRQFDHTDANELIPEGG